MVKLKVPEGVTHVAHDRGISTPINGVVEVTEQHAQTLRKAGFVDLDVEQPSEVHEAVNLAGQAESNADAGLPAATEGENASTDELSASAESSGDASLVETHTDESQGKSKKGKK